MPSFKPRENREEDQNIWNVTLPLDVNWGIYARQSTQTQVLNNTQSTEMQTDDLIQWLAVRGVQEGSIALFDADLGVSGTKRIDERTGLQELVEMIKKGKIKGVLVYQISRLFRDETGVQYNVFADICKQHNCILVTADGMIFNFRNPMHVKMFRFLAEMAAEYIPQHIGMLYQAKIRKAKKGLYAGLGIIPKGFIVDTNKESPTFNKYIVYRPHADIIFFLFKRFFELGGNLNSLCKELEALPIVFPFFESHVEKQIISRTHLKKVDGGYHITRRGLRSIFTNPVYIGWWIVCGDVISKNNHERIIDEEHEYLFWYAFSHLADYTIEGEVNQKQAIAKRYYHKKTEEPEGLLKDCISGVDGKVHVHLSEGFNTYCMKNQSVRLDYRRTFTIEVDLIDREFCKRLFEHLRSTHDFANYRNYLQEVEEKKFSEIDTLTSQLQEVERQKADDSDEVRSIRREINQRTKEKLQEDPGLDPEKVKEEIEKEYAAWLRDLRKSIADLENTKTAIQTKLKDLTGGEETKPQAVFYGKFHEELEKLIPIWNEKPFKARQDFVNLFVSQAILSVAAPHWVRLDIHWSLPGWESETLFIYRRHGKLTVYTEEEKELVRQHYPKSSQEEILMLLRDKTWTSIKKEGRRLGLKRLVRTKASPFPVNVSWDDVEFAKKAGIDPKVRTTICVHSSAGLHFRWHSRSPHPKVPEV